MRNRKIEQLNPNYPDKNGHHPQRLFVLAPHHYLIDNPTPSLVPDNSEGHFRILRSPAGEEWRGGTGI